MSLYRCDSCDNYYDADFVGCNSHPTDVGALLCNECSMEIEHLAEIGKENNNLANFTGEQVDSLTIKTRNKYE